MERETEVTFPEAWEITIVAGVNRPEITAREDAITVMGGGDSTLLLMLEMFDIPC